MTRLVLVALLLGVLGADRVLGSCSCKPPDSSAAAAENADLVFAATVVGAHTLQPKAKRALHGLELKLHDWGLFRRPTKQWLLVPYDLIVTRAWKGTPPAHFTVFSAFSPSECGAFEEGRTYLVYATRDSTGDYSTHLCAGTRELTTASSDLQQLGTGSAVAQPPSPSPDSPTTPWWAGIIAVAIAAMGAIAWRMWRVG